MPRKSCAPDLLGAECIALNYLLDGFPEKQSQSRASQLTSKDQAYVLTFSAERDLVETLSFLSKIKDGNNDIPAVCVEQSPNGDSLKLLLAVNKSTPKEGDGVLQRIKEQFEGVLHLLHNAEYSKRSPSSINDEQKLRHSIIEMCRSRILCRLKLTTGERGKPKSSIKDKLQKAIEGIHRIRSEKLEDRGFAGSVPPIISKLKEVTQLVNGWLNYQVTSSLAELVMGIWQVSKLPDLLETLKLIPTGASGLGLDTMFGESLFNIFSKVGRYHRAARILYRIAKKFPIVRNMQVQLATPPPEAFERHRSPEYSPDIHGTISLLGIINGHRYGLSQISRHVRCPQEEFEAQFAAQTWKTLTESKIHSEIQIIAYCEMFSTPKLYPRVIASSKDACFLCNAFIAMHGKMHTSRTHGTLYPGWRLPSIVQFKDLQGKFNNVLLDQARRVIGDRIAGQASRHTKPFCESTLLPMSISTMTMESQQTDSTSSGTTGTTLIQGQTRSQTTSSLDSLDTYNDLSQGQVVDFFMKEDRVLVFVSGSLKIYLELGGASKAGEEPSALRCKVERLQPDAINKSEGLLVVDPTSLNDETTYELPSDNSLYVSFQDTLLRITSVRPVR